MSGYVYFAHFDPGFIKIGHSAHPLLRVAQIRSGNGNVPPAALRQTGRIMKAVRGTQREERALQSRFSALPNQREWFRNTAKLRLFIQSLPHIELSLIPAPDHRILAGARIDRDLWLRFAAAAKRQDKSVADLLEEALRAALVKKAAA